MCSCIVFFDKLDSLNLINANCSCIFTLSKRFSRFAAKGNIGSNGKLRQTIEKGENKQSP